MTTYTESLFGEHTNQEVRTIAQALRSKYSKEASKNQIWLSDLKKYEDQPAEVYNKKFDEYMAQREIYHAYFNLYLATFSMSVCQRRSQRMRDELSHAICEARRLGLTIY